MSIIPENTDQSKSSLLNPESFTKFSNQLLEKIASSHSILSGRKVHIVLAIIRKTLGWKQEMDWVSRSQIAELINYKGAINHISRDITSLVKDKVLIKDGRKLGINPELEEWFNGAIQTTKGTKSGTIQTTKGTKSGTLKVPNLVPTKDTTKDNYKETLSHSQKIEQFQLKDSHVEYVKKMGLDVDLKKELESFKLYCKANTLNFADYDAAFLKFLLNAKPSSRAKPRSRTARPQPTDYQKLNDLNVEKLKRDFAGFKK